MSRVQGPRHAGPRHRVSWWRGHWPPVILLVCMLPVLAWEVAAIWGGH